MNKSHSSLTVLARLASIEYQRKFIVNGTKQEYVLSSEVIDDVSNICRNARNFGDAFCPELTEAERTNIKHGLLSIEKLLNDHPQWSPDKIDNQVLIEQDDVWRALRNEANACLQSVHFNLQEWERAGLD